MPLKKGKDPTQIGLFATPLELMIEPENEVRVIGAYVDQLDLVKLGFASPSSKGASSYGASVLLKIYLYGYLNRIRSSRQLAKACRRNIEMMWLTGRLEPKYHTIADFRKNNPAQLKELFKEFVVLCKSWDLIGGEVLAVDGTKIRCQNAMKNNYTEKKLERHLAYIEKKTEEVLKEFKANDERESERESGNNLKEVLEKLSTRKAYYEELQSRLGESGQTQLSTTDADARALPLKRNIVEVGYNVQSVVDERNKLIVGSEVTNEPDINALGELTVRTCNDLGLYFEDRVKVLADKGYHNARQLAYLQENNIETYVASREQSGNKKSQIKLLKKDFLYDVEKDEYICPNNERLGTNGTLLIKRNSRGGEAYRYRRYRISYRYCVKCPLQDQCVSPGRFRHRQGRYIERNEHEGAIAVNGENLKRSPQMYKSRQSIVEHPFGTIKRHWGYSYTLLRTKQKVEGEWSLVHLCYNLRRIISIIGVKALLEALKTKKPPQKGDFLLVLVSGTTSRLRA